MAKAEVDMSIIVQPGYHGFDHAYMIGIINQFPSKFRGILLANPGKEGVEQLQALVRNHGFVGVRFNPALWPSGEPMSNAAGKALFHEAGRLGVPGACG